MALERFVERMKAIVESSKNGEATIYIYNNFQSLYRLSERARAGDKEADMYWRNLPERARSFFFGLNYLNE